MTDSAGEPPIRAGDVGTVVQLSPCVGGLVATWSSDDEVRLWSTPDADTLRLAQGRGHLTRTVREEGRFREVGTLVEARSTLILTERFAHRGAEDQPALDAQTIRLEPPGEPAASTIDDLTGLLAQAIATCTSTGEFLVVERGGWDAPDEPYCLFVTVDEPDGPVNVIETLPQPHGSQIWEPHLRPDASTANLSAPASPETTDVIPMIMLDAILRWNVSPWQLALTFGTR